ncbi:hypothetical protein RF55_16883 [Lasius niger]|uniref:DUF4780 domain-containing protein n=1 Tax=Lasius niger TaxID=67767 RepID=A0A0J7MWU1_LASNI|nr:hypothetical protein RF55_16883 [Lasius niger]
MVPPGYRATSGSICQALGIRGSARGVATLRGKRPEENRPDSLGMEPDMAQPQADKTRIRFSGAARRRYKKQKQLEGKGEAGKPAPTPTNASVTTPRMGEPASTGTCKRLRSEQSTPSPSGALQVGKRPKIAADQRSFAQATSGLIRIAMVPMNYPDRKLDKNEASLLKEKVRGGILGLARGTKAPTFKGTSDRDGAVIFNCTDKETEGWLQSLTLEISAYQGSVRAT